VNTASKTGKKIKKS